MRFGKTLIATALCVSLVGVAAAQTAAGTKTAGSSAPASPEQIFAHWDKDKNSSLSLEEFKAGWQEIQMGQLVRKLHGNFVAMDSNKSGALEANEFANLEIVKKSKTPVQMATFDADKNQKLDFKEYVGMLKALSPTKR